MEENSFQVGQLVKSKSGRDRGRLFLILHIIDHQYVLVVDGSLRRMDRPKKKKIKHLNEFNIISEELKHRVLNNKKINNAFIRKELERLEINI